MAATKFTQKASDSLQFRLDQSKHAFVTWVRKKEQQTIVVADKTRAISKGLLRHVSKAALFGLVSEIVIKTKTSHDQMVDSLIES